MEKILILEDNQQLLQLVSAVLKSESYQVFKGDSLKRAKELLKKVNFDLLILDRVLKDGDSIDLIEEIREVDPYLRILVLSKKRFVEDRIKTLSLADDFLAKPFTTDELLLKIRNLLRRSKLIKSRGLKLSDDTNFNYGVIRNSGNLVLRKKERLILECLLKFSPAIVNYDLITSYVWGYGKQHPSKKTINVYVRRIRMKLGNLSGRLETIRGQGYRYIID